MSPNFKVSVLRSVRPYNKLIGQLTKPVLRVLIQVSVHFIESKKCTSEVLDLALNKLNQSGYEIPNNFCELFAAILHVMQIFLRSPKGSVKEFEFRDCLKDLRFTEDCIDELSKVLYTHRATLAHNLSLTKMDRFKIYNMLWRINISINFENNQRITPTVILHFKLLDDKYRTLELPLGIFHTLRYNVAILLNELHVLESRTVMKKF